MYSIVQYSTVSTPKTIKQHSLESLVRTPKKNAIGILAFIRDINNQISDWLIITMMQYLLLSQQLLVEATECADLLARDVLVGDDIHHPGHGERGTYIDVPVLRGSESDVKEIIWSESTRSLLASPSQVLSAVEGTTEFVQRRPNSKTASSANWWQ